MMDMMSWGYIYVHVCCCDRAWQIGENGSLRKEGWGEGRGYSEVPRWWPPLVLIKDYVILALMDKLWFCIGHMLGLLGLVNLVA
jgi:hypothetical protein